MPKNGTITTNTNIMTTKLKNIEHEFCEKRNLSLINIIFDPSKLFPNNWETNDLPGFKALLYLEPKYLLAHSDKSRLRVIGRNFQRTF